MRRMNEWKSDDFDRNVRYKENKWNSQKKMIPTKQWRGLQHVPRTKPPFDVNPRHRDAQFMDFNSHLISLDHNLWTQLCTQ